MPTCSKCKQTKPYSEFQMRKRPGKGYYSQCRECVNVARKNYPNHSAHKIQEPKSDAAKRTQELITARLTFFPFGCVIPPNLRTGAGARYCPLYAMCSRIPAYDTVLCEVSDEEAEIDVTKPVPDSWLREVAAPLRQPYMWYVLDADSSEFE